MKTTKADPINLSIFLPFFNEEKNITFVVEDIVDVISKHARISRYEIIMVNDGSKDSTQKKAEELVKKYPQVRLITHEENKGYGGAVISGIQASQFDYIFYMDGDNQFNIREIDKLLEWIPEYEVVIGYRAIRQDSFHRKLNALLWNGLMRLVFHLRIRDIDCAFKIIRRDRVSELPLVSHGAMISTELLVRLLRKGVVIKEVPVEHYPRKEGKPTGAGIKVISKAFKELYTLYKIV